MKREELIFARKKNLYTQYSLAKELGISQAQYSCIENGYRQPSEDVALRLKELLGIQPEYFLGQTG